jgi:hypothetical protein
MKLGEALAIRSDLQKRIAQMGGRLQASAVVQEGDQPPEDPAVLLRELSSMSEELEALITAINLTNAVSVLPDGRTLTAALATRDVIGTRQGYCAPQSTRSRRPKHGIRALRSGLPANSTLRRSAGSSTTLRGSVVTWTRPSRSTIGRLSWSATRVGSRHSSEHQAATAKSCILVTRGAASGVQLPLRTVMPRTHHRARSPRTVTTRCWAGR